MIDELLDKVIDKDGKVDYITMNPRTLRSYNALLRGLGGAGIMDTIELPSGERVPAYRDTPIFKNINVPITLTKGDTDTCTTIYAGTVDDGSSKVGISGLTTMVNSGIVVNDIGESHTKDEDITRVKFYCGLALFNEKGLAAAEGITN